MHKKIKFFLKELILICAIINLLAFSFELEIYTSTEPGFHKSMYVRTQILISLMILHIQFCLRMLSYAESGYVDVRCALQILKNIVQLPN